ncbi:MAG: hypothetical protein WEE53_11590 [Acidimicrobiia bacterium]
MIEYQRSDHLSFLVALKEADLVPEIANAGIRDNDYWTRPASTGRVISP